MTLSECPTDMCSLIATLPEAAQYTSVSRFFIRQEAGGSGEASPSAVGMVSAEVSKIRRRRSRGGEEELGWQKAWVV